MGALPDSSFFEGAHTAGEAHNQAMALPLGSVVAQLSDLLGATTVAAIGGVHETRAVQHWIDGERAPQRAHVLRFALQLALMISSLSTRDLARAWFYGSNPHLDDLTPVQLLRDQSLEAVQVPLMIAVRSFVARSAT
jgi:hypothetical protein